MPTSLLYRRGFATAAAAAANNQILGCGSNVVDRFFRVKGLPKPGEKGYFADPMSITDASVVGGVTLNHLSWASQLSVPTGGMFLQGNDAAGKMIRKDMETLGVCTELVQVDDSYTTAESYVILDLHGERSIIMASGATSLINNEIVKANFSDSISECRILSTEISQVPMSGVIECLRAAKEGAPILTVLDVDVQPSVAVEEALLGTLDELTECVMMADVLKPAKHAAQELLAHLDPSLREDAYNMTSEELALRLREVTGSKLVALTSGSEGCVMATETELLTVPPFHLDAVTDATGAGDAFLGGLLAGLYHENGVPETTDGLQKLGELANATGAACCQVLGALPDSNGRAHVRGFMEQTSNPFLAKLNDGVGIDERNTNVETPESNDGGNMAAFAASLQHDVDAVISVAGSIDEVASDAFVSAIKKCTGRVLVTGLGKSGVVARRMAVSLASTGSPAHFVHAAEWVHGDLGSACQGDVVIAFSHSGKTAECVQIAAQLEARGVRLLAIAGVQDSPLVNASDSAVVYTIPSGAEPVGGAPTTSVVAQEAVVNAVVNELIARRGFTEADFKFNHPGGSLGQTLKH